MLLKKIIPICFIAINCINLANAQSGFSWPKLQKENKPWTRWWWMGNAVDTQGIKYNLKQFQKAGIGGVEITPIYGVNGFENKSIEFLSPEWMKMLGFTIKEAHELNMGVDMNNGTGWPFGGPQISIKDAASKAIFQTYTLKSREKLSQPITVNNPRQKGKAPVQIVMAFSEKGDKIDLTNKIGNDGKLNWIAPEGSWNLIAVFNGKTFKKVERAAPGSEGWVMDPFSTKVLQEYLQSFTESFSGNKEFLPHAFFDDSYEIPGADWTKNFFNKFAKRRGYRLENYLPALLGKGNRDTVERVISDYRQTLAELLLHDFAQEWTSWAHDMGSLSRYQAHGSPGNLLDLYAAADIPEIESFGSSHFNIPGLPEDSLGDRSGKLDPLLLKFASSAAHVTGKKFASSETFTWLGEHFRVTLSQCKPVLDYMLLSGINHVFFHGSPYSPKGAPWPGWQFYASMNFTPYNTFWKDIPAFTQYIGRSQSFLQKGKPDNDVLLYWPVQDVWAMTTGDILYRLTVGNATQWLTPTPFHQVGEELMQEGYGFDYISDKQLQHTNVLNGLLKTPGAAYQAIIIPPCKYMPVETLQQIVSLAKAGAKVIFAGSLPQDLPGLYQLQKRRKQFQQLKAILSAEQPFTHYNQKNIGNGTVFTGDNIKDLMQSAGIQAPGFPDAGLQFIRRKDTDGYIYFVSNLHSQAVDKWIPLAKNITSAVFYDPYTGHTGKAAIKTTERKGRNKQTLLYLQLKPGQSMIIKGYINKNINGPSWHYTEPAGKPVMLDGSWKVSFEKGSPVINKSYTMDHLASWTSLSDPGSAGTKVFAGTAKYTLIFDLPGNVKPDDWLLNLGEVDFSADVEVNGHSVGSLWAVPFEVKIGKYLKPGKNILEVNVTNIGANRIAGYDRKGIKWKIFKDINVVNMKYKPFDASSWKPVPSGLLGPVTLTPLREVSPQ